MKESRSAQPDCIRITFNSEIDMLYNGGVSTSVTYFNGIGTFNGSPSKILFTKIFNGIKSIRIKFKPYSTTQSILKLTSTHSVSFSSGTLAATGFSSPTIYNNGVVSSVVTTGWNDVIITTTTAIKVDALIIGQISSYYTGDIDLIELFTTVQTSNQIQNIFSNRTNVPFKSLYSEILNAHAFDGVIKNRANSTAITNTAVNIVRSGQVWGMAYNGSTSLLSCGTAAFTDATFVCFATFYEWGESNAGRLVDNGKFKVYISSTNNRVAVTSDGSTTVYSATNSIVIGTPYMIAVTRKADGKASVYLATRNSAVALSGSTDQASGTPATGTTAITFGNDSTGAYTMNGVSKQWMLTGGILSLAELTQIWSSNKHLL